jgi:hypothetical protein
MKKEIIEDIINALIKITVFEYKNAKDGRLIDCTYKNHYTTNAVIKNCQALCLHDYPYDILRDQAYASIYESIVKMANNYTEDELILIYSDIHTKKQTITNQFLTGVYKKSVFSVKAALSGYRRNGKGGGMIPAATFVELLEENLTNEAIDEDQALDIVFFLQWFESNKEKFLTPKQLEFLENPVDKANKYTYKKRIYENTMRAYKQEFDNCDNDRQNLLDSQIRTLENILDAEDFAAAYLKNRNKAVVIDAMTDMDLEILKAFNLGYRNYDKVLKPMRVALYHKLNSIYALLEK